MSPTRRARSTRCKSSRKFYNQEDPSSRKTRNKWKLCWKSSPTRTTATRTKTRCKLWIRLKSYNKSAKPKKKTMGDSLPRPRTLFWTPRAKRNGWPSKNSRETRRSPAPPLIPSCIKKKISWSPKGRLCTGWWNSRVSRAKTFKSGIKFNSRWNNAREIKKFSKTNNSTGFNSISPWTGGSLLSTKMNLRTGKKLSQRSRNWNRSKRNRKTPRSFSTVITGTSFSRKRLCFWTNVRLLIWSSNWRSSWVNTRSKTNSWRMWLTWCWRGKSRGQVRT